MQKRSQRDLSIRKAVSVIFCFLLVPLFSGVSARTRLVKLSDDPEIETIITKFRASIPKMMQEENVPGLSIALITLRHLLSHTAGFAMEAPIGNNFDPTLCSFEEHIKSISDTWLRYPVGQRYSYSNLGVDLAGYILQVVSGKSFGQYMKEKLFDPIGMANSSVDMKVIKASKNRAIGHSNGFEEARLEIPMIPAGGVYTSAIESAKFIQFHLNKGKINGRNILDETLLNQMYTIPFPIKSQMEGYALGIDKRKKHNTCLFSHGGGGYGFLVNMTWYPELGIGLVILTNSSNNSIHWKSSNQIIDKIIQATAGKTQDQSTHENPKPTDITPSKLKNLVGNYVGRWNQLNLKHKDKSLGIQSGENFRPFKFSSDTEANIGKDFYRFKLTSKGRPSYIIKVNNGHTWDYNGGPNDKPGPDKQEWEKYVGQYAVKVANRQITTCNIYKKNGYLYIAYPDNELKLEEYKPGLFFTSTGEALDLRGKILTGGVFVLEKEQPQKGS